jgi:hypothetical protein
LAIEGGLEEEEGEGLQLLANRSIELKGNFLQNKESSFYLFKIKTKFCVSIIFITIAHLRSNNTSGQTAYIFYC